MAEKGLILVDIEDGSKPIPFLSLNDLKINDKVVVEIEGISFLGRVVGYSQERLEQKPNAITRKATEEDIKKAHQNNEKSQNSLKKIKETVKKYNFEMKIVAARYSLDCNKLIICFSSENRVDFRDFVKELASIFKVRIELKQIGSRDECKTIGGLGVCGKVCCCKEFLPDFAKVSIKMAKNQNISLNPQKINGLCGRLMCCLSFENDAYSKIMAKMPKLGSMVETEEGNGVAIYNDVLGEKVNVKITHKDESFDIKEFDLKDIKVLTYAIKD